MSVTPSEKKASKKIRAARCDLYREKRGRTVFIPRSMVPEDQRDAYVAHAKAGNTKYFIMKDPEASDRFLCLRESRGRAGVSNTDVIWRQMIGRVASVKRLMNRLEKTGAGYNKIVIASDDSRHG